MMDEHFEKAGDFLTGSRSRAAILGHQSPAEGLYLCCKRPMIVAKLLDRWPGIRGLLRQQPFEGIGLGDVAIPFECQPFK